MIETIFWVLICGFALLGAIGALVLGVLYALWWLENKR